jgi:hypothetical protein
MRRASTRWTHEVLWVLRDCLVFRSAPRSELDWRACEADLVRLLRCNIASAGLLKTILQSLKKSSARKDYRRSFLILSIFIVFFVIQEHIKTRGDIE